MKLSLSLDEQLVARARRKAEALGKTLDELVGEYLRGFVAAGDEHSIEEFTGLSGQGDSGGWTFDREEVHRRK